MFNTQTKKMIVGLTSDTIYKRFSGHLSGRVDNLSKKAANYVKHKGPHFWIIPLAFSDNTFEFKKKFSTSKTNSFEKIVQKFLKK